MACPLNNSFCSAWLLIVFYENTRNPPLVIHRTTVCGHKKSCCHVLYIFKKNRFQGLLKSNCLIFVANRNNKDSLQMFLKMCTGSICILSGWVWCSHYWDGLDMIGWQSLSVRSRKHLWRLAPSDSRSMRLGNQPFSWEVFTVTVCCGCLAAVFLQAVNLHRH